MNDFDPVSFVMGKAAGGGGGSDLPAVTSDDNGDVLTVVNGAWDKAAPSGGGGVLWCNYSGDDIAGYSIDKSFNEIKAAIDSGVMPVLVKDDSSDILDDNPSATEIWAKSYFYISSLCSYLNGSSEPIYWAYFEGGIYTFSSTDADADMVEF